MREDEISKFVVRGAIALFCIIILFGSFAIVPAGSRGVLLTFGKPDMMAKDEGFHFKIPIAQKIKKMSVQTLKYEASAGAASKDLQVVSTNVAVNFHLVPETVPKLYQELGVTYSNRVIQPAVQEVVKAVTARFTAEELITKRPEVKEQIQLELKDRLTEYNMVVEQISITNFDFSESFNTAIEEKVKAEQLKLKAERDLERIKIEKEQIIAQAQAQAESLRLQKQEITPDLIRLREMENQKSAIEKWDGVLPKVTGGAMPFIDVSSQLEEVR